ncbi:MAG: helix-turn-helix transcriptional regulator [Balneolaceae bacterium]|nr:helix-turn-helix transcriptional regulator [Balneolaceae bacterium]MBO6546470.1 helix-turn-helix transcriptional regulator [Balneolaceae bacterium]MBO6648829.1 helix-turn-helix transcriptional regulator [Balneolaceae bacterium]
MRRDVFQAIADPTRRDIITLLASGDAMNLNSIADQFDISRPAISKHIKILEECNLIDIQQEGRERICELKPEELEPVSDWVEKNRKLWDSRLDRLENYLNELQTKNEKND